MGLAGDRIPVHAQGLQLKSIINNSPHGDASRAAPAPDDLIYVAHVPDSIDAADYIHTVLANARECAGSLSYHWTMPITRQDSLLSYVITHVGVLLQLTLLHVQA